MVRIDVSYEGDLRCRARHAPTGADLLTDAPPDNQVQGRGFSPTDLLATAFGTCVLTLMGLAARAHDLDLAGATASVEKTMASQPRRRIGRLTIALHVPRDPGPAGRQLLETAAHGCPVHASLGPDVAVEWQWRWGR